MYTWKRSIWYVEQLAEVNKHVNQLVGKKLKKVFISELKIAFVTDDGIFAFKTEDEAYNGAYFHGINGMEKVLGKEIHSIDCIEIEGTKKNNGLYGYRMNVIDDKFALLSAQWDFRNDSPQSYGGFMYVCKDFNLDEMTEVKDYWLCN